MYAESGFTSCEDELIENITPSLISSTYTDDGGNTWKSSSGSTIESLTKCEELDDDDDEIINQSSTLSPSSSNNNKKQIMSSRLSNITTPINRKSCIPVNIMYSHGHHPHPHHHHHQPQHHQSLSSRYLTKCQSLQDLSKCLTIHNERLNNTYNSSDTINSQSLSSTKDSGFQRSYSSNSICSVRRNRNKYDHIESKVKQYIRNIKDNERKHKAMKENIKRHSMHLTGNNDDEDEEIEDLGISNQNILNSRRSSLQNIESNTCLFDENDEINSCSCNKQPQQQSPGINNIFDNINLLSPTSKTTTEELIHLFHNTNNPNDIQLDEIQNKTLSNLIKKLEIEKLERDLLIENLQCKYFELNNKLSSANNTINDLKQQVTNNNGSINKSISYDNCYQHLSNNNDKNDMLFDKNNKLFDKNDKLFDKNVKLFDKNNNNRYFDYKNIIRKQRLSPVPSISISSQCSNNKQSGGGGGGPNGPVVGPNNKVYNDQQQYHGCSSRSSQTSSKKLNSNKINSTKKINLPKEDPFVKVKRWQDSLTSLDSSDSNLATTSSPIKKSSTIAFIPFNSSPIKGTTELNQLLNDSKRTDYINELNQSLNDSSKRIESSNINEHSFQSIKQRYEAIQNSNSNIILNRSKTAPDIKRKSKSTVLINIQGKEINKNDLKENNDNNLLQLDKTIKNESKSNPTTPIKTKQITILNIFEKEDGSKCTEIVEQPNEVIGKTSNELNERASNEQIGRASNEQIERTSNSINKTEQPNTSKYNSNISKVQLNQSKRYSCGTFTSSSSSKDRTTDSDLNESGSKLRTDSDLNLRTDSDLNDSGIRSNSNYNLSLSKTTPNLKSSYNNKRVSINLSINKKNSPENGSSDSLNTTTDDDYNNIVPKRPPSVPPNTRLFKELSSLKSCLNEVDEQIHVLKSGIDNLIKSSSQKSVHHYLQED